MTYLGHLYPQIHLHQNIELAIYDEAVETPTRSGHRDTCKSTPRHEWVLKSCYISNLEFCCWELNSRGSKKSSSGGGGT